MPGKLRYGYLLEKKFLLQQVHDGLYTRVNRFLCMPGISAKSRHEFSIERVSLLA